MAPYKYLNIVNHNLITEKLNYLILNSLYCYTSDSSDIHFSFNQKFDNQKLYDINDHKNFWNFLDRDDVLKKVPELIPIFNDLDIIPIKFYLVVITEGYGVLHSDAGSDIKPYRINWPIYNCDIRTKTFFYKLKKYNTVSTEYVPPSTENSEMTIKTKLYAIEDIDYTLGYYVLTKPVLFNYHIPHNVVSPKDADIKYPRVIMSIDFESETLKL